MSDSFFDALILGAGVSGLTAAQALAHAGRRVAVIEARPRIGGRIDSIRAEGSGLPIELGAEFVHGRPEELWRLISQAGAATFELDGEMLNFADGQLKPSDRDEDFSILDKLPEEPDQSFADWIRQQPFPPETVRSLTSYVEGFNAADANVIGTASLAQQQRAEKAIEGDRIFRVKEGYAFLADALLRQVKKDGGELFLSTIADTVSWKRGFVQVHARNGERGEPLLLSGRQCIVTLPLGVLQAGSVRFDPVPEEQMRAAQRLAMGSVKKIIFVFRGRFWEADYPEASFFFSESDLPSVWWTASPDTSPTLTGWIGGTRAQDPGIADQENLLRNSLATLAKIFALPAQQLRDDLVSWHMHDWSQDPFSRGAYSYVPKDGLEAVRVLTQPVDDTLFFAGEHTDLTGHWGTVHAAMRSGLRAAQQALTNLQ